jgi:hypothetical protein
MDAIPPVKPETGVGIDLALRLVPSPMLPKRFRPQHRARAETVTAQECSNPAETILKFSFHATGPEKVPFVVSKLTLAGNVPV